MKVRFEAKVTRGFSLSPRRFRDSLSPLRGLLLISFAKKNQEKPLAPGYTTANFHVRSALKLYYHQIADIFDKALACDLKTSNRDVSIVDRFHLHSPSSIPPQPKQKYSERDPLLNPCLLLMLWNSLRSPNVF